VNLDEQRWGTARNLTVGTLRGMGFCGGGGGGGNRKQQLRNPRIKTLKGKPGGEKRNPEQDRNHVFGNEEGLGAWGAISERMWGVPTEKGVANFREVKKDKKKKPKTPPQHPPPHCSET